MVKLMKSRHLRGAKIDDRRVRDVQWWLGVVAGATQAELLRRTPARLPRDPRLWHRLQRATRVPEKRSKHCSETTQDQIMCARASAGWPADLVHWSMIEMDLNQARKKKNNREQLRALNRKREEEIRRGGKEDRSVGGKEEPRSRGGERRRREMSGRREKKDLKIQGDTGCSAQVSRRLLSGERVQRSETPSGISVHEPIVSAGWSRGNKELREISETIFFK